MKESRSILFSRNDNTCELGPHSLTQLRHGKRSRKDRVTWGVMVVNAGRLEEASSLDPLSLKTCKMGVC